MFVTYQIKFQGCFGSSADRLYGPLADPRPVCGIYVPPPPCLYAQDKSSNSPKKKQNLVLSFFLTYLQGIQNWRTFYLAFLIARMTAKISSTWSDPATRYPLMNWWVDVSLFVNNHRFASNFLCCWLFPHLSLNQLQFEDANATHRLNHSSLRLKTPEGRQSRRDCANFQPMCPLSWFFHLPLMTSSTSSHSDLIDRFNNVGDSSSRGMKCSLTGTS